MYTMLYISLTSNTSSAYRVFISVNKHPIEGCVNNPNLEHPERLSQTTDRFVHREHQASTVVVVGEVSPVAHPLTGYLTVVRNAGLSTRWGGGWLSGVGIVGSAFNVYAYTMF